MAVQEFYCSAGLYYNQTQSELANHISFELTARATLARAEAEARVASDRLDVQKRVRDQARVSGVPSGPLGDRSRALGSIAGADALLQGGRLATC